jgi:hypothetical protein
VREFLFFGAASLTLLSVRRPERVVRIAALFLFLFSAVAHGAQQPLDPSDDFTPMLFLFAVIGICIVFLVLGAGIAATVVIGGCAGVLILFGVISSAAFVGIIRRRFSSGVRALHYQLCAITGLPAGLGTMWLCSHLFRVHLGYREVLLIGSLSGICAGLIFAFLCDRLAGAAYRRFFTSTISDASTHA